MTITNIYTSPSTAQFQQVNNDQQLQEQNRYKWKLTINPNDPRYLKIKYAYKVNQYYYLLLTKSTIFFYGYSGLL